MKRLIAVLLFTSGISLLAQNVVLPTSTVDGASLPSLSIGAGTSWNRGAAYPYSGDFTIGVRLGTTPIYSWTSMSTPFAVQPAGSPPLPSTLTTGAAWAAQQSKDGRVTLLLIGQVGFSTTQVTSSISPAFNGSFAVAFRPWLDKAIWFLPYIKAANPTTGVSGSVVTAILQPGFQVVYGFGGK